MTKFSELLLYNLLIIISLLVLPTTGISQDQNSTNVTTKDVLADFSPTGWMGDLKDIKIDVKNSEDPHSLPICTKISYNPAGDKGWAGIYWQYPSNNWGDNPQGYNLTGAKELAFWAKGSEDGVKAEFKVGGITGEYPDSLQTPISTGVITLSDKWEQYAIDLAGQNLSHVIGGFCWVTNVNQNPNGCTIYLDDIMYK